MTKVKLSEKGMKVLNDYLEVVIFYALTDNPLTDEEIKNGLKKIAKEYGKNE